MIFLIYKHRFGWILFGCFFFDNSEEEKNWSGRGEAEGWGKEIFVNILGGQN